MIKGMRNKNPAARNGCALCYNLGSAGKAFAYVIVKWPSLIDLATKKVQLVEMEVPVCFVHAKAKTENNPNGILDPEYGNWYNPFNGTVVEQGKGGKAGRDELYRLVGDNIKLLIGTHGRIPGTPTAKRITRDLVKFETDLEKRKIALEKLTAPK
jgi:hypothetical protein